MMKPAAALTAVLAMAACGTTPAIPFRADGLARQISDDAAAFNEAYAKAVSSQLLLNILRSRDRLPRTYLAMTGIQDAPSLTWGQNVGVGGVPLGQASDPWGVLSFGVRRETTSRPTYAVQPMSADTLSKAVFQPTPSNVFEHYWNSGWPRDLIVLLMVERMSIRTPTGTRQVQNEANDVQGDCRGTTASEGCAFVSAARAFLDATAATPAIGKGRASEGSLGVCGLIDAYAPTTPVHALAPPSGQYCEPAFVVGDTIYVLSLRSFDDIVYYVGELMRPSLTDNADGVQESPLTVRAAGLRGGGAGTPLFRIIPDDRAGPGPYAASVSYAGQRWHAGPAVGRSCAEATASGPCRDAAETGDRSSSVLSLLTELLALNQSPESIRAPSRLVAE